MDTVRFMKEVNQHLDLYNLAKNRNDLQLQFDEITLIAKMYKNSLPFVSSQNKSSFEGQVLRILEIRDSVISQMSQMTQLNSFPTMPAVVQTVNVPFVRSDPNGIYPLIVTPMSSISSNSSATYVSEPLPSSMIPITKSRKNREAYVDRPLSSREIKILKRTSIINGYAFLPWMEKDSNDFSNTPFIDSFDYHISSKYGARDCSFQPPLKITSDPVIIKWPLNPLCIVQNSVADCTIVSSIISCANYEVRFKKPLITGIIHPQRNGRPLYNPTGKYIIKLYFNGIPRKVEVDHRILVTTKNRPLCTFSKNEGELWPILLEKAFLKVHGGYDYDGGNGGQDTYSITGWIPENVSLREIKDVNERWMKLSGAFNTGDCLLTVSTKQDLGERAEERIGLAEAHCYCVMRMETIEGYQLLQLRNPWGRCSWKGRFSYQDNSSWTPSLRRALCPDYIRRHNNPSDDDGLFWIEFTDFQQYFKGFNVNWSPELLNTSITYHDSYTNIYQGNTNDMRNMSNCPQYIIQLNNQSSIDCPLHIMMSRHYTEYTDMLGNDQRKIICSMQVYKLDQPTYMVKSSQGQLIRDEVIYTNIPYDTCHVIVSPGHHIYSIVILQYKEEEKNRQLFDFSLQIRYPTILQGTVLPISEYPNYHFSSRSAGMWTNENNGGRPSLDTYKLNPRYHFKLNQSSSVQFKVESVGIISIAMYLRLIKRSDSDNGIIGRGVMINESIEFASGASLLETQLEAGEYSIIASTFDRVVDVTYVMTCRSSFPISFDEEKTVSVPLPDLGLNLRHQYVVVRMMNAKITGQSVLGLRGLAVAEKVCVIISQRTLLTIKAVVSIGSVPIVGVFAATENRQLPSSMTSHEALMMSNMDEDSSSTVSFVELNPGFYFVAFGVKEQAHAIIQMNLFGNNPLQLCYIVC